MAETTTITHTRSINEIVDEYVKVSDSGTLRLQQARLAFEWVGNTEGQEASELRDQFRKVANPALQRKHETPLTDPAVTNLVNTWKYLVAANVVTDPELNPNAGDIAKAAFNLAGQTFRGKNENYVNPAIKAIVEDGKDPEKTFESFKSKLLKDKKADSEKKAADRKRKEQEADKAITYDSLVAMLKTVNPENVGKYTAEQKSTIRDLLANVSALVSE
jgi:hypothetical protein